MIISRRVGAGVSLTGLAATALLAWSAPAQANQDMNCDSGGNSISCMTFNSAYGESWEVSGVPYPAGDGQNYIQFRCQRGTTVGIYVTYINTSGDQEVVGTSAYCGFFPQ